MTEGEGRNNERFHYSLELENAIRQLLGQRWYNSAGTFRDPERVRAALLAAVAKIKRHIDNSVAPDDRLLLTTSIALARLEGQARALSTENNSDLEIIAHLLELVAFLLGFDWMDGEPHRQLTYHQKASQMYEDHLKAHPEDYEDLSMMTSRMEIAVMLHERGHALTKISWIMRLPYKQVKDMLVRAGRIQPRVPEEEQS